MDDMLLNGWDHRAAVSYETDSWMGCLSNERHQNPVVLVSN